MAQWDAEQARAPNVASDDSEAAKKRQRPGRHGRHKGRGLGSPRTALVVVLFLLAMLGIMWRYPLEHHLPGSRHDGANGAVLSTSRSTTGLANSGAAHAAAGGSTSTAGGASSVDAVAPRNVLRSGREGYGVTAAENAAEEEAQNAETLMLLLVSDNPYQYWQMALFHYHYQRVKQPGKLVTIVSSKNRVPPSFSCEEDPNLICPMFVVDDYSVAPDGDVFVVYNRAWALEEFLRVFREGQANGINTEYTNVVIVEPDFIPLRPLNVVARRRAPIGYHYFYMEPEYPWSNNTEVAHRCNAVRHDLPPIGVPYIIHIDDLWEMLPLWIDKTRASRFPQPWADNQKSWIADMWGFACASASLGWNPVVDKTLAPEPPIDSELSDNAAFIHYTYPQDVGGGETESDKEGSRFYFNKRDWWKAPMPRPMPEFPSHAMQKPSKLQQKWHELMNEALVAVFGPSGPDSKIKMLRD